MRRRNNAVTSPRVSTLGSAVAKAVLVSTHQAAQFPLFDDVSWLGTLAKHGRALFMFLFLKNFPRGFRFINVLAQLLFYFRIYKG
jgi:hypothetical protein